MSGSQVNPNAKFGTLPVFLTALSTILGAILFLRFGWAVGQLGFYGVMGIIVLGHLVTIPTAMAVAEIATNQKVQGGGAYYIISRSFGFNIGAAIGMALYLSQAISVAFYVIAFGEVFELISNEYDMIPIRAEWVTFPTMAILSVLMLSRGANMGMKALYWVAAILITSLTLFVIGKPTIEPEQVNLASKVRDGKDFFYVFTIIFPAFTGLAAGLGLSGDLKHPEKSIPRGTIWATIVGFFVYVIIAYKFATSANPQDLSNTDQLIMSKIALWGPIIPIGLAAASLSSALGSIMIAPRTLQAIGGDDIFPNMRINSFLQKGRKKDNEPINASVITILLAFSFLLNGEIDSVARIISMFFMITYGAICLISLLEHFAADPAYRPTFRSHWFVSLIGTLFSFWVMFKMDAAYAAFALIIMAIFYYFITKQKSDKRGFNKLFRGVVFQLSRELQVFAQRADRETKELSWRPFAICISLDTFKRRSAFDVMRWVSYKYGFGTYIHFIKGLLNEKTSMESKKALERLLNLAKGSKNRVYLDTIISPSYTSAIAQVVQLQGVSGRGNNLILFEFSRSEPENIKDVIQNYNMLDSAGFDICILNTGYKSFGYKKEINIWIKPEDYQNANLMILLAYIILGHPDWKKGFIKIFVSTSKDKQEEEHQNLVNLIKSGRIPISPKNVEMVISENNNNTNELISQRSMDADLTIVGFQPESMHQGVDAFTGLEDLGNILYVCSNKEKKIQ